MVRLAFAGCGVIGERRALNLPLGVEVVGCYDPIRERALALSKKLNTTAYDSLEQLISEGRCEALVLASINSALVPSLKLALLKNIFVLVEKPVARAHSELMDLLNLTNLADSEVSGDSKNDFDGTTITINFKRVKVGFNHRFHPAFEDLINELKKNPSDAVMYINARYGNGARLGFDKEWRSQPELAGGGELLDQGVHLLDLATQILPDLKVQSAWVRTHFWNMPVDDNAWAVLSTVQGQTFAMHVSSSEWKNHFSFEVHTRNRKYLWSGLGRSYGPEKLVIYKMKSEMGPPDIEERCYAPEDTSWLKENGNFIDGVSGKIDFNGNLNDASRVLKLVADIYQKSLKTYTDGQQNGDLENNFKHPSWWQKLEK